MRSDSFPVRSVFPALLSRRRAFRSGKMQSISELSACVCMCVSHTTSSSLFGIRAVRRLKWSRQMQCPSRPVHFPRGIFPRKVLAIPFSLEAEPRRPATSNTRADSLNAAIHPVAMWCEDVLTIVLINFLYARRNKSRDLLCSSAHCAKCVLECTVSVNCTILYSSRAFRTYKSIQYIN